MLTKKPTIILRHRRENLKKCSLRGLENRSDFQFFTYPQDTLSDLSNTILLKVGAPALTEQDSQYGLFLIDATWKLAAVMEKQIPSHIKQNMIERSLPLNVLTAYPRRQTDCPDPEKGLASIEALYVAHFILKRPLQGLLDNYYWREEFLKKNPQLQGSF